MIWFEIILAELPVRDPNTPCRRCRNAYRQSILMAFQRRTSFCQSWCAGSICFEDLQSASLPNIQFICSLIVYTQLTFPCDAASCAMMTWWSSKAKESPRGTNDANREDGCWKSALKSRICMLPSTLTRASIHTVYILGRLVHWWTKKAIN